MARTLRENEKARESDLLPNQFSHAVSMEEIRPNAAQGRPDLSFFAYSQDVSSVGRAAATSTSEDPVVILSDTDEVEAMVVSAENHTTTTEGQTMTTVTVPASESAPDVHTDDATALMDTYETSGIARATPTVQADTESPTTQPQQLSPAPSNTKRQDDPSSLEDFRSPKRRREEPVDDDRSEVCYPVYICNTHRWCSTKLVQSASNRGPTVGDTASGL